MSSPHKSSPSKKDAKKDEEKYTKKPSLISKPKSFSSSSTTKLASKVATTTKPKTTPNPIVTTLTLRDHLIFKPPLPALPAQPQVMNRGLGAGLFPSRPQSQPQTQQSRRSTRTLDQRAKEHRENMKKLAEMKMQLVVFRRDEGIDLRDREGSLRNLERGVYLAEQGGWDEGRDEMGRMLEMLRATGDGGAGGARGERKRGGSVDSVVSVLDE